MGNPFVPKNTPVDIMHMITSSPRFKTASPAFQEAVIGKWRAMNSDGTVQGVMDEQSHTFNKYSSPASQLLAPLAPRGMVGNTHEPGAGVMSMFEGGPDTESAMSPSVGFGGQDIWHQLQRPTGALRAGVHNLIDGQPSTIPEALGGMAEGFKNPQDVPSISSALEEKFPVENQAQAVITHQKRKADLKVVHDDINKQDISPNERQKARMEATRLYDKAHGYRGMSPVTAGALEMGKAGVGMIADFETDLATKAVVVKAFKALGAVGKAGLKTRLGQKYAQPVVDKLTGPIQDLFKRSPKVTVEQVPKSAAQPKVYDDFDITPQGPAPQLTAQTRQLGYTPTETPTVQGKGFLMGKGTVKKPTKKTGKIFRTTPESEVPSPPPPRKVLEVGEKFRPTKLPVSKQQALPAPKGGPIQPGDVRYGEGFQVGEVVRPKTTPKPVVKKPVAKKPAVKKNIPPAKGDVVISPVTGKPIQTAVIPESLKTPAPKGDVKVNTGLLGGIKKSAAKAKAPAPAKPKAPVKQKLFGGTTKNYETFKHKGKEITIIPAGNQYKFRYEDGIVGHPDKLKGIAKVKNMIDTGAKPVVNSPYAQPKVKAKAKPKVTPKKELPYDAAQLKKAGYTKEQIDEIAGIYKKTEAALKPKSKAAPRSTKEQFKDLGSIMKKFKSKKGSAYNPFSKMSRKELQRKLDQARRAGNKMLIQTYEQALRNRGKANPFKNNRGEVSFTPDEHSAFKRLENDAKQLGVPIRKFLIENMKATTDEADSLIKAFVKKPTAKNAFSLGGGTQGTGGNVVKKQVARRVPSVKDPSKELVAAEKYRLNNYEGFPADRAKRLLEVAQGNVRKGTPDAVAKIGLGTAPETIKLESNLTQLERIRDYMIEKYGVEDFRPKLDKADKALWKSVEGPVDEANLALEKVIRGKFISEQPKPIKQQGKLADNTQFSIGGAKNVPVQGSPSLKEVIRVGKARKVHNILGGSKSKAAPQVTTPKKVYPKVSKYNGKVGTIQKTGKQATILSVNAQTGQARVLVGKKIRRMSISDLRVKQGQTPLTAAEIAELETKFAPLGGRGKPTVLRADKSEAPVTGTSIKDNIKRIEQQNVAHQKTIRELAGENTKMLDEVKTAHGSNTKKDLQTFIAENEREISALQQQINRNLKKKGELLDRAQRVKGEPVKQDATRIKDPSTLDTYNNMTEEAQDSWWKQNFKLLDDESGQLYIGGGGKKKPISKRSMKEQMHALRGASQVLKDGLSKNPQQTRAALLETGFKPEAIRAAFNEIRVAQARSLNTLRKKAPELLDAMKGASKADLAKTLVDDFKFDKSVVDTFMKNTKRTVQEAGIDLETATYKQLQKVGKKIKGSPVIQDNIDAANTALEFAMANPENQIVTDTVNKLYKRVAKAYLKGDIEMDSVISMARRYKNPAEFTKEFIKMITESATNAGRILNVNSQLSKALNKELQEAGHQVAMELPDDAYALWNKSMKVIAKLEGERKTFMISQMGTAARNALSQQTRSGVELITDTVQGALQSIGSTATGTYVEGGAMMPVKQGFYAQYAAVQNSLINSLNKVMGAARLPKFKKTKTARLIRDFEDMLDMFEVEKARFFRTPVQDVKMKFGAAKDLNLYGKTKKFLTFANFAQEMHYRTQAGLAKALELAERYGTTIQDAAFWKANPQFVEQIVDHSLQQTFAENIKHPAAQLSYELYRKAPFMTMLGNPFIKFWTNSVKFLMEYNPHSLLRVMADKNLRRGLLDVNAGSESYRLLAKGMIGTGLLAGAASIRNSKYAGPKWYQIRPNPDTDPNKLWDIRAFPPFSVYMYEVEMMKDVERIMKGEKPKLKGTDHFQALLAMNRVSGTGLVIVDLMRSNKVETWRQLITRYVGQILGGWTTAGRTYVDYLTKFDPESGKLRSTSEPPRFTPEIDKYLQDPKNRGAFDVAAMLSPMLNNIPWANKRLQTFSRATEAGEAKTERPVFKQVSGITTKHVTPFQQELDRIGYVPRPKSGHPTIDRLINAQAVKSISRSTLIDSAIYKKANDEQKEAMLRANFAKEYAIARKIVFAQRPELFTDEMIRKWKLKPFQQVGKMAPFIFKKKGQAPVKKPAPFSRLKKNR